MGENPRIGKPFVRRQPRHFLGHSSVTLLEEGDFSPSAMASLRNTLALGGALLCLLLASAFAGSVKISPASEQKTNDCEFAAKATGG